MRKNSEAKYMLSLFITMTGLFLAVIGLVYLMLTYDNGWNIPQLAIGGVLAITGAMAFILVVPFRKEARQQAASDEYGNKKEGYKNLSSQERKMVDLQMMAEREAILSDAEFRAMIKEGTKNPEQELNALVGLADVRQKVMELKAQMEFAPKSERHAYHACFLGNPGTGKTTVAGIMAGLLKKYGYIKKNEYISTSAAQIIASSNPLKKMELLLMRAHGSVLFIDEAYAFMYSGTGGAEILALLLNEMENSRDNLTVILAGYNDEMRELFEMNSGLRSRINTYLFFKDYSGEEMEEILTRMAASRGYTISPAGMGRMFEVLCALAAEPSFANARTARKLLDDAILRHCYRMGTGKVSEEEETVLGADDVVDNAAERAYFAG